MKLARPDIRPSADRARRLPRAAGGRRRRRRPGRGAAPARPARPLAVLGRPGRPCDADLVILRATWDYIDRLDEFLAWSTRVRQPAERARRGRVEHRQALPGRPRRRRCADRAEQVLRAGGAGAPAEGEVVVKPAIGAGSVGAQRFTDARAAREHAAALHDRGQHRAGAALRPAGWRTARRRWCSSAASSRTPSPRARCCRRR